jgi:hypothetical protein
LARRITCSLTCVGDGVPDERGVKNSATRFPEGANSTSVLTTTLMAPACHSPDMSNERSIPENSSMRASIADTANSTARS